MIYLISKLIRSIVFLAYVFLSAGCAQGDEMTKEDVNKLIASELSVGKNSDAIENFFIKRNLPFSYNKISHRYQSIIRDVGGKFDLADKAIIIHIYVDEERRFIRAEAEYSFTAL